MSFASSLLKLLGVVLVVLVVLVVPYAHGKGSGTIALQSSVDGATVRLDGKEVGKTPLAPLAASVGTHQIEVRKLGHVEFRSKVEVRVGATVRVLADLLPVAGVLKVTAGTRGANVVVDGKSVGRVPGEFEVAIGRRVVVISSPGYGEYQQVLTVNAGATYTIKAQLKKGASTAAVADLELAPIADTSSKAPVGARKGGGSSKASASKTDDLDLVPLAPIPPAGSRGTARTSKTPSGGPRVGAAANKDDLDLEPLVVDKPKPKTAASEASVSPSGVDLVPIPPAVEPAFVPPFVEETVAEPKPWYKQYWVWGVATSVVVASGVAYVASRRDGGAADSGPQPDLVWPLGQGTN